MTMVHPIAESDAAIPEKLLITTIIVSVMDAWCGLMLMMAIGQQACDFTDKIKNDFQQKNHVLFGAVGLGPPHLDKDHHMCVWGGEFGCGGTTKSTIPVQFQPGLPWNLMTTLRKDQHSSMGKSFMQNVQDKNTARLRVLAVSVRWRVGAH